MKHSPVASLNRLSKSVSASGAFGRDISRDKGSGVALPSVPTILHSARQRTTFATVRHMVRFEIRGACMQAPARTKHAQRRGRSPATMSPFASVSELDATIMEPFDWLPARRHGCPFAGSQTTRDVADARQQFPPDPDQLLLPYLYRTQGNVTTFSIM